MLRARPVYIIIGIGMVILSIPGFGGPQTQRNGVIEESAWEAIAFGQEAETQTRKAPVSKPHLDLEISGPKLRYLDRKASYVFTVLNSGAATAKNVTIQELIPEGFKFQSASDTGKHDVATRTVVWSVGEVAPGQAKIVKLDAIACSLGAFKHQVIVKGTGDLIEEKEWFTKVKGLSAMSDEPGSIDIEDPIEPGEETAYEIRITNTGSKTKTEIQVICSIPINLEIKRAQGPCHYRQKGNKVIFEPLRKLAPRADAIYRISGIGKDVKDDGSRFHVEVSSQTNAVWNDQISIYRY